MTVRYDGGPATHQRVAALTDVDLRIGTGERVVLIGPSGAGKSTLLGLLNGTRGAPTAGTVWALGRDLSALRPGARRAVQRRIGTVYQQHHLVPNLRVVHNVNAGHLGRWSTARALFSLVWPQDLRGAHDALVQVGIGETLWAHTTRLSVGQQQRVAIARVLVQDPDAILADESVASLDPERARAVLDLLARVCREKNKTLVVSLHQVDLARDHFARIVGLRAGRIVFDGSPADLSPTLAADLYRLDEATVAAAERA